MLLAESASEHVISRVFLAIGCVIVVARLAGMVARRLRQPAVVGEIIGGILLGPTLLGAFPGELDELLFPAEIRPFLTVIANLGLIIFMFIVGLELDPSLIKGKERIAGTISLTSIALPLVLGVVLSIYLHREFGTVAGVEVKFLPFALFIGAAMSITAFPVLARIMLDRGMYRTQIGALTLACAAFDDVLAWALLAVVLAVIKTGSFLTWEFPKIIGWSVVFTVVMVFAVRPLLARLVPAHRRAGRLTPNLAAIVIGGFLFASFATSEIGVHHILGAFTFGAMMPRRDAHALNTEILERLEQVTLVLLLPVFFVATGLAVDVGALRFGDLGILALILATACVGKFVGATAAARALGVRPWRRAAAIGTLMNTRGLTELIILTIGREAGVLDDRLFTMMVVMAIVTTVITEPLLRVFYPDRMLARDIADAQKMSGGAPDAFRVFVAVDEPADSDTVVALACDVVGDERPSEVVLSCLVALDQTSELGSGTSARLADITASLDAMAVLERQVTTSGVGARVLTRFSTEPVRDIVFQAQSNDIDLLVVAGHIDGATDPSALADELDRPVAIALRGESSDVLPPGRVLLAVAEDDHGIAAFELAVRVARTRGVGLDIQTAGRTRRWESTIAPLSALGVSAAVVSADASPRGLVVAGGEVPTHDRTPELLLRVYAPPELGRTVNDVLSAFDAGDAAPVTTPVQQ